MEIKVKSTTLKKDLCVIMSVVLILPQLLLCGGSLANGIHTFGNYVLSDGNVTEGNVTYSDITPGDITPGDITPGDITPGDITPGDITPGDITPGDITPGDITPGDITPGDITPGDITPGDITPGNISCGNITPGEIKWINITPGNVSLLEFIPSETGNYVFTSHSEYGDTYGFLYNANLYCLTYDDDSGTGNNFKIQYTLKAGETYYFGARFYNKYNGGSFQVSLSVYEYSPFTFSLNDDGNSYILTKCDRSYSGEAVIPSTYKGKPVTRIGDYAFYDCSGISTVTVPDGVTSIGAWAFGFCSNLTSVALPDSVTSIEEYAFYGCYSLASIKIPDSVTGIGDWVFYECSDDLIIYSKPGRAEAYAKEYGLIWKNICQHIDENRDYICESCGYWVCDIIPDATKEITLDEAETALLEFTPYVTDTYVFTSSSYSYTYGYLYDAEMNVLAYDDDYADNRNFKIKYTLEAGKTYYFGARFYDEYNSGSFNLSLAVYSPFTFTLNDDGSSYTFSRCDESYNGEVVIPATFKGKPVTSIGYCAFYNCSSLTSVTIPDSVTSIGDYAFSDCSGLTSVTIPDSVTSIGYGAFGGCSSLTSIEIPDSITSIGDRAFSSCSSLTSVTIPDSITSIGNYAFEYCSSLTAVTIPDSVTSIGYSAFSGCSSLTSINVVADNKYYSSQDGVLFNKDKTELICCPGSKTGAYTIPNSVTSIGDYAFRGCSSLKSVTIPDSVTSIGYSAFSGCSSLTSVIIPNSITSIDYEAFYECSSLTSVVIPYGVTSIGSFAFRGCSSLASVTIPDSVTSIFSYAFANCSSLTSVTIPDSVTSIGDAAFAWCSDDLVIYSFSGSYAEMYAYDNSIEFQPVSILPDSDTRIDYENKCIFGEKSVKVLDDCLITDTDIEVEYEKPSTGFIGTGTLVTIKSGDTVIDTFTVVINGDLDGDGVSDVLDVVLANRALNGYTDLSDAQAYAANNAADTNISSVSYKNVVDKALGA